MDINDELISALEALDADLETDRTFGFLNGNASQELLGLQIGLEGLYVYRLEASKMLPTDPRKERFGKVIERLISKTKNQIQKLGEQDVTIQ